MADQPQSSAAPDDQSMEKCAGDVLPPSRWRRLVKFVRSLGPAGPLAILAGLLPAIGLSGVLAIAMYVKPWLRAHTVIGLPVYALCFTVCGGLALVPTYASSALSGWTFGFWPGLAASLGGLAGACLVGYAVAARASGDRVVKVIEQRPRWKAVYDALLHGGFWKTLLIVTLIRIPPTSAFAVTNLIMASTRVPRLAYLIGTVVGMTPRTAAVVYAASRLHDCCTFTEMLQRAQKHENPWMVVFYIGGSVAALFALGFIANRALAHVTRPRTNRA